MKIEKIKPKEDYHIIVMDNGTEWDLDWEEYYVSKHLYGPYDIDEWREHAKTMLMFYEVVELLRRRFGELRTEVLLYGSEEELVGYVYLNKSQYDVLLKQYKI